MSIKICPSSLCLKYPNICLSALGAERKTIDNPYESALTLFDNHLEVADLPFHQNDWTTYCGNNSRSNETAATISNEYEKKWETTIVTNELPTAPVVSGDYTFVADRTGAVQAQAERWSQRAP